jgi:tetratricopeptide (TPR) repeat protein
MGLFKSLFGGGVNTDKVLDECIRLVRQGQVVEGLSRMKEAVESVKTSSGERSLKHAQGLFHLATLYISAEQLDQAAIVCREAAECCPSNTQGKKDRLTYLMNTGQMLSRLGKNDEAIDVLTVGLAEREALYGLDHAGTAYGQQALAEVMLRASRFDEGVDLASKALDIFASQQHQETLSAMVTLTALRSAAGDDAAETFSIMPTDTEDFSQSFVIQASDLAGTMPDESGMDYLEQLSEWASNSLPAESTALINATISWSNLATDRNHDEHRRRAMDRSVELARQRSDKSVLANVLQGKALLMSDIGTIQDVREAYQEAYDQAMELDLSAEAAGILRNWAIAESDVDGKTAIEKFQSALQLAEKAQDNEVAARTQIALGIFHQHHKAPEQARPLLKAGIDRLGPLHSDAACGLLHQVALDTGLSCPCHGGEEVAETAVAELAKRYFEHSGLDDLIGEVAFVREGENPGLHIRVIRKPNEKELERMQIAHSTLQSLLLKSS